ncbi:hypothetical protein ACHQM5_009052 [Ranunculus cassubicifolius]
MQATMARTLYDSSFSFSKRYFKLKKKHEDEDNEENSLYSFTSSQLLEEEENTDIEIKFPSSKKKRSSKALTRLCSMFRKNHTSVSSGLGTKVVCTLFGYRNGNVNFAFQEDATSDTGFFIELPAPTSSLIREMASGVVRIVLECDKLEKKGMRLLEEALWRTYCNGNKCGIAIRQEVGSEELKVLKAVGPISMGAGVIPGKEGELMYMRAMFERVVGSRHSEAFYMMNLDGPELRGPELSIYLFRV